MNDVHEVLLAQFERLKNDCERWKWLQKNSKRHSITVWLDNDDTFATFDDIEDSPILDFSDYVGWSDGIRALLDSIGIQNKCV